MTGGAGGAGFVPLPGALAPARLLSRAVTGVDWFMFTKTDAAVPSDYFIAGADRPSRQGAWHRLMGSISQQCPASSNSDLWSVRLEEAPGRSWTHGPQAPGSSCSDSWAFPKTRGEAGSSAPCGPWVGGWRAAATTGPSAQQHDQPRQGAHGSVFICDFGPVSCGCGQEHWVGTVSTLNSRLIFLPAECVEQLLRASRYSKSFP